MKKSPCTARVIWTTSHDTPYIIDEMDWEDWQILKATKPYEMNKYQIQLVSHALDLEKASMANEPGTSPIRHLVCEPGITSTNIFSSHLNFFTDFLMWLAFIIVSSVHPIVHMSLTFRRLVCLAPHTTLFPGSTVLLRQLI